MKPSDGTGGTIAYVVPAFPRISETFIINEILELERRGLDLRVYTLLPAPDEPVHASVVRVGSPVTCLCLPLHRAPRRVLAAHARMLARHRLRYVAMAARACVSFGWDRKRWFRQTILLADAVARDGIRHLHAGFVHAPGTVVWQVHRLTGISHSATAHAKDLYLASGKALRRKLSVARFVLTCTEYNRAHLEELIGDQRICSVYHGVDLDVFDYRRSARDLPPVVLSVARLVPKKGIDTLIEACSLLRRRGRTFQCRIIGTGELEASLKDMSRSLGLEGTVRFEGSLDQERVRDAYRRATLFALPCRITSNGDRDGLPNVLVEAAACGVPIVTTPVSGIPELVRQEETGLLTPSSDPHALAGAIERLLDDEGLREVLRSNARAVVEERFDLRRNAQVVGRELGSVVVQPEAAPSRAQTMHSEVIESR